MDTPRGTNGLHKPRKPLRRRIRRTLKRIRRPEAITLEEGLDKLAELLGLHDTRIDDPEERAAVTTVRPTEHHARSIYYAPITPPPDQTFSKPSAKLGYPAIWAKKSEAVTKRTNSPKVTRLLR